MSQRTTKPTIRLMRPAKTQISLSISTVWSVFPDGMCLLRPLSYPTRHKRDPCHAGLMYRLIWVIADHTGLIVGFVVRWLVCFCWEVRKLSILFGYKKHLIWSYDAYMHVHTVHLANRARPNKILEDLLCYQHVCVYVSVGIHWSAIYKL